MTAVNLHTSKAILELIQERMHLLSGKRITLGFDGFIDSIYKVAMSKDDQNKVKFFASVRQFGTYLVDKGEANVSIEIEQITTKIGGNTPIMTNALSQFGSTQYCIAAMGYPSINPLFQSIPSNCELFSFSNPGMTTALEFNGGKIMLGDMRALQQITWSTIKENVGLERLINLFSSSDLVCLLNWSEIDNSTSLWRGILSDVLPNMSSAKKRIGFFDLSDCSKRSVEAILEALELLQLFTPYLDVVLSLNYNEANLVFAALTGKAAKDVDIEEIGQTIYQSLRIAEVVIHHSREALRWDGGGLHHANSMAVTEAVIATGAGDNFNAGYCAGLLMGLKEEVPLILAHATSHLYMVTGRSPSIHDVVELLKKKWNLT